MPIDPPRVCDTSDMPNQPKTPTRVFRIDDQLYFAAMAKAEAEGRTLSDVVREALTLYVGVDRV